MQLASDSTTADVINAIAAMLWVLVAIAVLVILGSVIKRSGALSKLALGPSGVSMEFVERKIQEASTAYGGGTTATVGQAAQKTVVDRLQSHATQLRGVRILWADDHPSNNAAIVTLMRSFGSVVDTPTDNDSALALLRSARYDVVISDVARDDEDAAGALPGLTLAQKIFDEFHLKTLLFTSRFDPATTPGLNDSERLELIKDVRKTVFGYTNRADELLHLMMDLIERE